jgi:site-specific recombinase XerD
LSPKRIHQILKEHFGWAAERLAGSDPEGARALSTASAHWLRHSLGNHLVEDGVGVDVVQGIFGHASIATTSSYYVRAGTRRMAEALRNLR